MPWWGGVGWGHTVHLTGQWWPVHNLLQVLNRLLCCSQLVPLLLLVNPPVRGTMGGSTNSSSGTSWLQQSKK